MIKHIRNIRAKRLADKLLEQEVALAENGFLKGPQVQDASTMGNLKIEDFTLPEDFILPVGERVWTEEDRKTAEATVRRDAETRRQKKFNNMIDEEEYLGQMQDRRAEYMAELAAEMYEPEATEMRI